MGFWGKLLKGGAKAVKVSSAGAKTVVKTVKTSTVGVKTAGLLAGLSTFLGLEWLTNGGLIRATSGATGLPEWASSLLWIAVLAVVIIVILWAVARRLGLKRRSGNGRR